MKINLGFVRWLARPALVLALAYSMPSFAQTTLTFGYVSKRDSHFGDGVTAMCTVIEKQTSGRYVCKQVMGGVLGGEKDLVDGVKAGTVDLTMVSSGTVGMIAPTIGILDIPFLLRDYAHARKVLDGPIGDHLLDDLRKAGTAPLAWSENGFRHMTNNKRAVHVPDDLKGLKVRTMENKVHLAAFKTFGMEAKPLPFPELFTALQSGTFDGEENPISAILASKLYVVQKHLTLTAHVYSPALIIASPKLWTSLSDSDRAIFLAAAKIGAKATRARVERDEREGVAFIKSQGVQVVTSVDRSAFSAVMLPARKQFEQEFGADKIAAITAVK